MVWCGVDVGQALKALVEVSEGDLRKSITLMQSAARLMDMDEAVTRDVITDVAGVSRHPYSAAAIACRY